MSVRVRVEPALLEWAVERAGWSEETAAQRVPKLEDWLAGRTRPTLKQLESFAHATHAPLGLLFLDDGRPDFTLSFAFTPDGRVRRFYSQLNPEKLRHLH